MTFEEIHKEIVSDPDNSAHTAKGYMPLYTAHEDAKILIIGQAPGIKAQESMIPWDDASGKTLRKWLGVTDEQFYDPSVISILPMDFYYPGKGKTGDLPPRKDFAPKWHPKLLDKMPNIKLTILVGSYAQKFYLPTEKKNSLTNTVREYQSFLPQHFPIVHPSPLNFRWQSKNPWFLEEVQPELERIVSKILT